ncbi:MAG: hypothetical protein ACR2HV_08745 [Acidimicrobiales bacterium]
MGSELHVMADDGKSGTRSPAPAGFQSVVVRRWARITVAVLLILVAVAVGALVAVRRGSVSQHHLEVVLVVIAAVGAVGALVAVALVRQVSALATRLGDAPEIVARHYRTLRREIDGSHRHPGGGPLPTCHPSSEREIEALRAAFR